MRRFTFVIAVLLSAVFAADAALAQARVVPRVNNPAVMKQVRPKQIKILPKVIPPSVALARAMAQAPGAKGLDVKLKGQVYVVKLLQGNKVKQLRIPATP